MAETRPWVVVIAAPGNVTAGVRDVLRDWAALGLVQPFLWVDQESVDPHRPIGTVLAMYISSGDIRRVRLQDELANAQDIGIVRLVALSVQGERTSIVPQTIATHIVNALARGAAGGLSPIQLVLTRHGAGTWVNGFEQDGWRTIVVAPEDAFSPQRVPTELLDTGDYSEGIAHSASALAAVSGLWTGMGAAPLDAEPVGVAEPWVARAFLRRLDAGEVAADVRAALTDISAGLPKPRSAQGPCAHLQNPAAGVDQMADAVLAKHAHLFELRQEQPDRPIAETLNWWKAILKFFSFLKTALLNTPRALWEDAVARGAQTVSSRIQNALYGGTDSRYEIVTRGINARGLPAGADEIASTAREVARRTSSALDSSEQSLPDLAGLWRDVIAGGLTLADAGTSRLPDIPPQIVQGQPGVVPGTFWVAPAPQDAFELSGTAMARMQMPSVTPYDAHLHDVAAQVLQQVAAEEAGTASAKDRFDQWRQRVTSSYTGRIARRLSDELAARQQRLAELLEILSQAQAPVDDEALAEEQNKLRRTFKSYLLGAFGITVVSVLLGVLGIFSAVILAVLSAAALIAWSTRAAIRLVGHQRKIFAIVNARQVATQQMDYAAVNIALAATALHLVATLYAQYLAWAPILGRFLREPFGPQPPRPVTVRLAGLLPRSVGFGVAVSDQEIVATVAAELSREVFEIGWLSELWTAMVGAAPRQLGPKAVDLRSNPQALLSDPAQDESSLLRQWSTIIETQGVPAGAGDAMWHRARSALLTRGVHDLARSLFRSVEVQAQGDHGVHAPLGGDAFFTELTDSMRQLNDQAFLTGLFQPTAQAAGLHRVATTVAVAPPEIASLVGADQPVRWISPGQDVDAALDQFIVVLQITGPLPSSELRLDNGSLTPPSTKPDLPHGPDLNLN